MGSARTSRSEIRPARSGSWCRAPNDSRRPHGARRSRRRDAECGTPTCRGRRHARRSATPHPGRITRKSSASVDDWSGTVQSTSAATPASNDPASPGIRSPTPSATDTATGACTAVTCARSRRIALGLDGDDLAHCGRVMAEIRAAASADLDHPATQAREQLAAVLGAATALGVLRDPRIDAGEYRVGGVLRRLGHREQDRSCGGPSGWTAGCP